MGLLQNHKKYPHALDIDRIELKYIKIDIEYILIYRMTTLYQFLDRKLKYSGRPSTVKNKSSVEKEILWVTFHSSYVVRNINRRVGLLKIGQ